MSATHRAPNGELYMVLTDRKRLAKLMLIQRISQRELAEAAGWRSHSYLGRLLRGEVKTLDSEPAIRIAVALGVGVDDLFVGKVSTDGHHPGDLRATRTARRAS